MCRRQRLALLLPGVIASAVVAASAAFLSEHYGAPVMLMALLLGMALGFLSEEGRAVAGIRFTSSTILRIGVALLGMRITLEQILSLGSTLMAVVIGAVFLTISFGILLARLLGQPRDFGILSGGSVGICGASAALAISAVLPQNKDSERNTIFTVISVTALSTIAMIAYPPIAQWLGLDAQQAGVFLGATIHDVAQVVGAGYSMSDETGDSATVIKLLRVAMLVPIVFSLSLLLRKNGEGPRPALPLPLFIIFFVVFVAINSSGVASAQVQEFAGDVSRWCLITAIAALGMKTSLKSLLEVGWRPATLLVSETLFLALLILGAVNWLG
ncbi:putative sulfate exporter family transporter [Pseudomonas lalucatii]|uniref:Sulfate exporter family transporter n=1 Tax=Pseudomonas lalucatii TaxID=1424203 RepID=A0ABS5PZ66_9PSED|nr:putative sulfate exporter family transporter [Pseudomonas lalucatii]MBS7661793.1 putative sulfate exporter family transporter [Pseudomonas lalucatii]MBS7726280.1 putative sulfate exporter family transporter [Pseudomonas lalucatii]